MTVDVHTHAIAPELPDLSEFDYAWWPSVRRTGDSTAQMYRGDKPFRDLDSRCWQPRRRLADMREEGVLVQVLSPIPATLCHDAPAEGTAILSRAQNDFLGSMVAEEPEHFRALGAVPLQDPELAVAELRRCMTIPGMIGVEIGTSVAGRELADPGFAPFFAAAEELGALVFIHPTAVPAAGRLDPYRLTFGLGMPAETATAAAMLIVSGAFDRWPGLRVCLAHGGGSLAALLPRMDKGWELLTDGPLVTCRRPPSDYAGSLWVDSLTYDPAVLGFLAARFGENRVVVGSDYPFGARQAHPGRQVDLAGLGAEPARSIRQGNGVLPDISVPTRTEPHMTIGANNG